MTSFGRKSTRRKARGLTLIELMIALVLGLVLIGGVISVVIANGQAYRTNEGLSQVQESTRTAFELLARDIREAGATACGNRDRIANTVNSGAWWHGAWTGIRGYPGNVEFSSVNSAFTAIPFGSSVGQRVAGTDAILIQSMQQTDVVIVSHHVTSAVLTINVPTTKFSDGDILMVCDFDHAAIFQAHYNAHYVTVGHNTGTGTPGNCSKGLGYPTDCSSPNGTPYPFKPNSRIAALSTVVWYIGNNGRTQEGGRSLFRYRLGSGGTAEVEEIVPGVSDMQLEFRPNDSASTLVEAPANWDQVTAVQFTITSTSLSSGVTTAPSLIQGRIERSFTTLVGLRNRIP